MDFNATIDLIIKDLNEASGIIDDLKNYKGVPVLQVELAKAKCKSAAEVISLLKTNSQQVNPVIPQPQPQPQPQPEPQPQPQPEPQPEPQPQPEPVKTEKKASARQPKSKPVPEQNELKQEKDTSENIIVSQHTDSHIIADKFVNIPASLNEQLGGRKAEEDVTEIIKSKPISSLREAIGINDRFLFQREIFNGDNKAYDQVISRMEAAESVEDAKAVLISFTGTNAENEAVKQLMDLVKRKLGLNE